MTTAEYIRGGNYDNSEEPTEVYDSIRQELDSTGLQWSVAVNGLDTIFMFADMSMLHVSQAGIVTAVDQMPQGFKWQNTGPPGELR